ncbi:uncharacterized protein LOC122257063 isoform X2 [Penaeus japonicus]|uniref:uncharacterized protein LOC122257063 isoform X2 n=1 Tax=Penaeus japonicus TaxID=27405 RepID=UPI001C7107E6|nr:uncharacterized protein LOC122257063 isoform X2 [Penaeus japonicus]
MGERVSLHGRCLALQLLRSRPPPSRPPPRPPASCASGWCSSFITPTSPLSSPTTSGSDTPTNPTGAAGVPDGAPTPAAHAHAAHEHASSQDGFLLFQAWQAANSVCVWDGRLVQAVGAVVYVGALVGGVLLVGGQGEDLDIISHAWARSLLVPPPGFRLAQLGEVSGCHMTTVPQSQFTPLGDALCWVIHRLRETAGVAEAEAVRASLNAHFPSLVLPDADVVHAALSTLIRQRKVYHTGVTYGIVQPLDAFYQPLVQVAADRTLPRDAPAELAADGPLRDGACHAAVQTDLAELITGSAGPRDAVLRPSKADSGTGKPPLESQVSLRGPGGRRGHPRTASLRLSPTRAAHLATALAAHSDCREQKSARIPLYAADDLSDVTVRGERGSMLSKLLRVSPRNRLASFSAQFPPPAWSDPAPPATTTHLHCVATQTTSQKPQVEQWWMATPSWSPRSSTLPRRLQRPRSSTPPTSRNSSTPPLISNNFQYLRESASHMTSSHHLSLGSATPALYPEEQLVLHASPSHRPALHRSPIHHPSPHSSPSHRPSHGSPAHRSSHPSSHSSPSHRPQPQGTPAHPQHSLKEFMEDHPLGLSPSSRNPESRINLKNQKHRSPARTIGECKTPPIPLADNRLSYKDLESSPGRSKKDQGPKKGIQDIEGVRKEPKDSAIKQSKECHNKKSGETKARKCGKEQQERVVDGESSHQEKKRHQHGNKGRQQKECFHSQEAQRKRQENIQNEENQVRLTSAALRNEDGTMSIRGEAEGEEPQPSITPNQKGSTLIASARDADPNATKVDKKPGVDAESNREKKDCGRYDRSALQLDLPHSHMNNSRKVNASPQRPEGLKNNVLHHNNSLANITKGSCSDLTARNLGYTEVDKCHKKLCSQTLDQLNQHAPDDKTPANAPGGTHSGKLDNIISNDSKEPDPKAHEEDTNKTNSSSSPDAENVSVKTYPSLSELNFNFGSLAAQRILCGASVNSLDTLVEVNLAAEKRKLQRKHSSPATPVTNTDLGFV